QDACRRRGPSRRGVPAWSGAVLQPSVLDPDWAGLLLRCEVPPMRGGMATGRLVRRAVPLLVALLASPTPTHAGFVTFESGLVRPLALSPDGNRLLAVDTPDARLEIFTVTSGGLTHDAPVPVGL